MRRSLMAPTLAALLVIAPSAVQPASGEGEQPRWRPIGPWGGNVSVLASDPYDSERLWAVSRNGNHLHVSEDGGRTWQWLGRRGVEGTITFLVPSAHTPGLLLAAAGGAVWRSRDWGHNWHRVLLAGSNKVLGLQFVPGAAGTAAVLSSAGTLFVTRDDGNLWHEAHSFRPQCGPRVACMEFAGRMAVMPDLAATVLVAADRVYRCHLGSGTCHASPTPLPDAPTALASFQFPAGSWLAVDGEAFTSVDGGFTWEPASEGLAEAGGGAPPILRAFRFDHFSGEIFALSGSGLLRWRAAARRWELADPRPEQGSDYPIGWLVRGDEHLFGAGVAEGLFAWRPSDGSVEARNQGIAGRSSLGVLLDEERGTSLVMGSYGGLWRWREEDGTWTEVVDLAADHASTTTVRLISRPQDPRHLLAVTDAGMWESTDAGSTWVKLPTPFTLFGDFLAFPAAFVSATRSVLLVGAPWQSLWRSSDLGRTWTELGIQAQAMAVHPHHPDHLWAVRFRTFFASRDGGRTWNSPAEALPPDASAQCPFFPCTHDTVTTLAVDTRGGETYYVGTQGIGLNRFSHSEGWTSLRTRISQGRTLILDPGVPGRVVAAGWGSSPSGVSGYVLVLEDYGARWRPLAANGSELPPVMDLSVSFRHGRYAVATDAGVFVLEDTPRDNRPLRRAGPSRR